MTDILEFTILGCGSSGGVPRADGAWGNCDPNHPLNRRTRCSMLVRRRGGAPENRNAEQETTLLVDTSPDLVRQTSAAGARRLDAVLMTHDHADQSHGIDDIRAFALRQRAKVPVWMDAHTSETMQRRFDYIFVSHGGYPAIGTPHDLPAYGVDWEVNGPSGSVPVNTFDQAHGEIRSVGYRFGNVSYSSDVEDLPDASFDALQGLDIWIVDALRYTPHVSHAHLAKTLDWIAQLKPKRAILTNLHIDMDYETLRRELPEGVEPAYDGMVLESPL